MVWVDSRSHFNLHDERGCVMKKSLYQGLQWSSQRLGRYNSLRNPAGFWTGPSWPLLLHYWGLLGSGLQWARYDLCTFEEPRGVPESGQDIYAIGWGYYSIEWLLWGMTCALLMAPAGLWTYAIGYCYCNTVCFGGKDNLPTYLWGTQQDSWQDNWPKATVLEQLSHLKVLCGETRIPGCWGEEKSVTCFTQLKF